MSKGAERAAAKRHGNTRTAAFLAAFAIGLFVFTLYSGLK